MAITRTAWTDDDGTGSTGTVINNAEKTTLYDQIDAALALAGATPSVSTVTTTGNIAALPIPAGRGDLIVYMNNGALATIQGIAAGLDGQRLTLVSISAIGGAHVYLAHQHTSASAANRVINVVTSGITPLAAGAGAAALIYDASVSRWRLTAHEQGDFIVAGTSAAYSGSASMVWTVDPSNAFDTYYLRGRALTYRFKEQLTSVSGTPGVYLQITPPNGWTFTNLAIASMLFVDNGGAETIGIIEGLSTAIGLRKLASATWTASTDLTTVRGQVVMQLV
jgi:hypothetical protein